MKVKKQKITDFYAVYNADCIDVMRGLSDNSIDYCISSPPFADLYTYSNSERDMSNCKNYEDFWKQFDYLFSELYRILKPGRVVSFHCMDLPTQKEKDGYLGIKDFTGDLIRKFQDNNFIYHSRVTIWKDPLLAAVRTKAIGLMYKQLCKDSTISRQGLPDNLISFRKPGENEFKVNHPENEGLGVYAGSEPPKEKGLKYNHTVWQKYASPVWMDVRGTNVLKYFSARDENDEKHLCPLQLDVIHRGIVLWSNEGDTIFDPFGGIGSTGFKAIELNRKTVMSELKESYFDILVENLDKKIQENKGLF